MVWRYTRNNRKVQIETRFDAETACYVLIVWRNPDGSHREIFSETALFAERVRLLEQQLVAEGWRLVGVPGILAQGWAGLIPSV